MSQGNSATNSGGGMEGFGNADGTQITLYGCTFSGNTASKGGGMYGGNASVSNCTFAGNTATDLGGGLRALSGGSVVVLAGSLFCENLPEHVAGEYVDGGGNVFSDTCVLPCPADINGSGDVNVVDLVRLLLCFGEPAVPVCVAEDINNDGVVNVLDLIALLLVFGQACP